MEPKHINVFVSSTIKVFKTMLGIQVRRNDVKLKDNRKSQHDVTGTVTLMGTMSGAVAVGLDEEVALRIAGMFLGAKYSKIGNDVIDAIGELTNMIVGAGKTDLARDGVPADISVPQVIVGKGHDIWVSPELVCVSVLLDSELGELNIDIRIKEND